MVVNLTNVGVVRVDVHEFTSTVSSPLDGDGSTV